MLLLLLAVVRVLSVVAASPCLAAAALLWMRSCRSAVHANNVKLLRGLTAGDVAVHALFLLATAVVVHAVVAGARSMAGFIAA